MAKWSTWLDIQKIDTDQRIVVAIASSPALDNQDDIIETSAMKAALPDYMEWANIREMHDDKAVGVVQKAEVLKDGKLRIELKVVDNEAWEKVKSGVYKGISIGGKALKWVFEKLNGKTIRRITKLLLYEISLVDRPANPDAKILFWKGASMKNLKKVTADSSKALSMLQAIRDEAESTGDLEAAQLLTNAIALTMQASGTDTTAPEDDAEEEEIEDPTADETAVEGDPEADAEKVDGGDNADSDVMDDGSEKDPEKSAAAKPTLVKAGKRFSKESMSSMHQIIKSMAEMMATAGDPMAAEVAKCYGSNKQAAAQPDLKKAMTTIEAQAEQIRKLAVDVAALKKQPVTDKGPALRSMDKTLPGQSALEKSTRAPESTERERLEAQLVEVRRLAMTDPNPFTKSAYLNDAAAIESRLSKLA